MPRTEKWLRDPLPDGYYYGGDFDVNFHYSDCDLEKIMKSVPGVDVTEECVDLLCLIALNAFYARRQGYRKSIRPKFDRVTKDAVALINSLSAVKCDLPKVARRKIDANIAGINEIISMSRAHSIRMDNGRGAAFNQTSYNLYRGAMWAWEALTERELPAGGGDADAGHVRFIKAAVDPVLKSLGLRPASGDAVRKRISDMISERKMYAELGWSD